MCIYYYRAALYDDDNHSNKNKVRKEHHYNLLHMWAVVVLHALHNLVCEIGRPVMELHADIKSSTLNYSSLLK
eukprot:c29454_g1_i1 orf=167-385(+)